ncbi:hypothetical protein Y032_0008g346 [Ancylostoma ceylanicum]|uniref:Uncharacterized protein n=1 Tax=Ancylostoma ceylanicum TaxID=53326 RepID=A0A016VM83_9BILA|nr:hypothetical protein Y032_0008g346 [Ancylostoma ceylanicum]
MDRKMKKRCVSAELRENALNQVYLCSNCPLAPKYSEKVPNARPSSDYYTNHVTLPTSHPLLRVLPTFVSEHTAPSFLYVQADCY